MKVIFWVQNPFCRDFASEIAFAFALVWLDHKVTSLSRSLCAWCDWTMSRDIHFYDWELSRNNDSAVVKLCSHCEMILIDVKYFNWYSSFIQMATIA